VVETVRVQRAEDVEDHDGRPEDALEHRDHVPPERIRLLPEVPQGPEDAQQRVISAVLAVVPSQLILLGVDLLLGSDDAGEPARGSGFGRSVVGKAPDIAPDDERSPR
jgi:hypothetical protein